MPINDLESRLVSTERTRAKIEGLFQAGSIGRPDAERVYEGLFMRAITALESYFEELFYLTVLGKTDHPKSRAQARADFKSRAVLREFVLGGRPYVDWLPYKVVEDRASVFLRAGRPFTLVDDGQRSKVKLWHITRNAIAHPDGYARQKFRDKVLSGLTLMDHEKTPAGYLRSSTQPGLVRFQGFLREMRQLGRDLS